MHSHSAVVIAYRNNSREFIYGHFVLSALKFLIKMKEFQKAYLNQIE